MKPTRSDRISAFVLPAPNDHPTSAEIAAGFFDATMHWQIARFDFSPTDHPDRPLGTIRMARRKG
jgi:hypothetical protein